jgi:hypothetical protein
MKLFVDAKLTLTLIVLAGVIAMAHFLLTSSGRMVCAGIVQ